MKSYHFYLIRHGISQANEQNRIVGSTDSPLSERGREQLREISEYLKPYPVEAVFSSPLSRATETARILYPGCNPIVIDDLREYHFGVHENGDFAALCGPDTESRNQFLISCTEAEGAEGGKEFCERIFAAFAKIVESCMKSGVHDVAIVTHSMVMMTLMHAFAYPKQESMFDWRCANGTGYLLRTDAAMWMRDRVVEAVATTPAPKPENE
ncbi:MAG: histidine phosphatase family protein [Clostridia bacterium]|nr:histidine phosphatase family protein [Clostridia bacterium]